MIIIQMHLTAIKNTQRKKYQLCKQNKNIWKLFSLKCKQHGRYEILQLAR